MQRFFTLVSRMTLAAVALALVPVGNAGAADYPTRQPHIIVGYPPGGSTDICARLFGDWLSRRLGQQFIVENRPGAGNNLASPLSTARVSTQNLADFSAGLLYFEVDSQTNASGDIRGNIAPQ